MKMSTSPLIIIAGPTATGKSEHAIRLAKAINGAVISADSMQVYRGMDIGSAKVTREEMQGIDHYLIDILDIDQEFNVALFQELARKAIIKCGENKQIPILTGGTGFYIQALLYEIDFTAQEKDDEYRNELLEFSRENGALALHRRLMAVDPEAAGKIPVNNVKRVIRALEFYRQSGEKISVHNERERVKPPAYPALYLVLSEPRDRLYRKIDERVDRMVSRGLVEEVKSLVEKGARPNDTAMQGIGYKQMLLYLNGELTLEEAIAKIKQDSRHFAKRQLTWFKREPDALWVEKESFDFDEDKVSEYIISKAHDFLTAYS